MTEDVNDLDDPSKEEIAAINRKIIDMVASDPGALEALLAQDAPGDLRLWLPDAKLTESQADELRSFILNLEVRACFIQPDLIEVFGISCSRAMRNVEK